MPCQLFAVRERGPCARRPGRNHRRRPALPTKRQEPAERIPARDDPDQRRDTACDPWRGPSTGWRRRGCRAGRSRWLGASDGRDQTQRRAEQPGDRRHAQRVIDQREQQDQQDRRTARDQRRALLTLAGCCPARSQRDDQDHQPHQHDNQRRQSAFQQQLEPVVVRVVDAERRHLPQRLDRAIDPLEAAEPGPERKGLAQDVDRVFPILVAQLLRHRREAGEDALEQVGPRYQDTGNDIQCRRAEQTPAGTPDATDERPCDDQRERQQQQRGPRTGGEDTQRQEDDRRERRQPSRGADAHDAGHRREDDCHEQQRRLMVAIDEEPDAVAAVRGVVDDRRTADPRRDLQRREDRTDHRAADDQAQHHHAVRQAKRRDRQHRRQRHEQR